LDPEPILSDGEKKSLVIDPAGNRTPVVHPIACLVTVLSELSCRKKYFDIIKFWHQ